MCVQNQVKIALILQMLTVRRLRELRKTLRILKLFQIFKEHSGFYAVQLSLTGRMTSPHCHENMSCDLDAIPVAKTP